ncbi:MULTISPECIES: hypothetical protein [Alphaproteobacteria]|uniref:hypothetical protein n=1 Tax=Alphaproteobacteria TaxID=28211 RepID=UPI003265C503
MRTVEKMHGNLIATTTQAADAALAPISTTMMRQLSVMLAQAQEQISAMQEVMAKDNVVQLSM